MDWIKVHCLDWRIGIFIVLLAAILGSWAVDLAEA
jgi:hypothetical protein